MGSWGGVGGRGGNRRAMGWLILLAKGYLPPDNICTGCSRTEAVNPGNTLYVTGLSTRVTERELEDHFSREGKVSSCFLVVEPRTRASRGFAFITMETLEYANRCVKHLHQSVLDGRCITVEIAIVVTVVDPVEDAMTMTIGGLQGAHHIEAVVITLPGVRLMVEGQEGRDRIPLMVAQKGTILVVRS
ncbi:hypothetical protein RHGRI_030486 [Rhododendron griersonianum]|uniref:RRM domain-containing protein n=1 Tax=Rhododendron griersonianum TaxID=479676 RepID=A0AAV6ISS7_9ERIC|nr:hypothetical protein RHGRI_030486 [Rhododendron griersonianum]